MRGIVMEITGKYAVILTEDGQFRKIKAQPGMTVGAETDTGRLQKALAGWKPMYRIASVAASLLVVLGIGIFSYNMPYSYVDFDINPSIGLTANIYDRIIGVEALNEDGSRLIGDKNLRNMRLEDGVMMLISSAVEQGYLIESAAGPEGMVPGDVPGARDEVSEQDGDPARKDTGPRSPADSRQPEDGAKETEGGKSGPGDPADGSRKPAGNTGKKPEKPAVGAKLQNAVMLTVSSNSTKKAEALKKKMEDTAARELSKDNVNSKLLVGGTSVKQREAAHKLGVTPGRLALIEEVLDHFPWADFEKIKNTPVKDLLKMVGEKEKQAGKEPAGKKEDTGEKAGPPKKEDAAKKENNGKKEDKAKPDKPAPGAPGKPGSANAGKTGNASAGSKSGSTAGIAGPGAKPGTVTGRDDDKKKSDKSNDPRQGNSSQPGSGKAGSGSAGSKQDSSAGGKDSKNVKQGQPGWEDIWKALEKQGDELKKEREKLRNELLGQMKTVMTDKTGKEDDKKPGARDPLKRDDQDSRKESEKKKQDDTRKENGGNTGKNDKNSKNDKAPGPDTGPKTPGWNVGPKNSGMKR